MIKKKLTKKERCIQVIIKSISLFIYGSKPACDKKQKTKKYNINISRNTTNLRVCCPHVHWMSQKLKKSQDFESAENMLGSELT